MAYLQQIELDWNSWKAVKATLSSATVYYMQFDLQYVPFVIEEGTSPIVAQSLYFTNVNRDPSAVSGPYAPLTSGSKDSLHIQGVTYTANVYGASGVTIAYVNDAVALGKEYVTVSGTAVTVHIVSGQSTAQQVVAAVISWNAYTGLSQYNSAASAYLVSAVIDAGQEGLVQTVQPLTPLAGGTPAVTVLSDWETNFKGTATRVASFSQGVALEI